MRPPPFLRAVAAPALSRQDSTARACESFTPGGLSGPRPGGQGAHALAVRRGESFPPKIVERLPIMILQHSKWFEDSQVKTCAKHRLCSPPRGVAEKAIAFGLATTQDSGRYFRLRQIGTVGLR